MDNKPNIQAKLKVSLLANDTEIAFSEDPHLWQRVLSSIMGDSSLNAHQATPQGDAQTGDELPHGDSPLAIFCRELEVTQALVRGGLSPSSDAPFLHLDARTWEDFRKNTPSRGPGAIPPLTLVGSALAIWFKIIGQNGPNVAQVRAVMDTIGLRDKNPQRTLGNCDWLQYRNQTISVNPAQASKAYKVVRAYCKREEM